MDEWHTFRSNTFKALEISKYLCKSNVVNRIFRSCQICGVKELQATLQEVSVPVHNNNTEQNAKMKTLEKNFHTSRKELLPAMFSGQQADGSKVILSNKAVFILNKNIKPRNRTVKSLSKISIE